MALDAGSCCAAAVRRRFGTGMAERKHVRSGGEPIEPLYGPDDVDVDADADLGRPGAFPFTRGVYETMYRGRLWTMRQYAGFGTAAETNRRYRYLLDHGQTGLSVAFDLPTQMGYDSDHHMAEGEVGRVGVAIASLDDMRTLFEGIPLEKVSVWARPDWCRRGGRRRTDNIAFDHRARDRCSVYRNSPGEHCTG